MIASKEELERLFRMFRHSIGAPVVSVEITDEQLCTALEIAIEDYSQYVQEWLIDHQWSSLLGQSVSTTDMAFALTTRSLDYETQFTYAYSKQVGLQARGPWELKKDYFELEAGRQVYQIPAGREINEVLWYTPNATTMALFAHYGGIDYGFGGGIAQVTSGFGTRQTTGFGQNGYYIAPAFDVLMTAGDMNLKNRMLRSEMTYKITAGPNGTRLIHLMSTPGSKFTFGHGMAQQTGGVINSIGLAGGIVWYHYYDTTPENVDQCRNENSDIIKLPNEVPLHKIKYDTMNEPTKVLVRQLFFAKAKNMLALGRGKFSGALNIREAEAKMDYESLLLQSKEEETIVKQRLDERLKRLSPESQMEIAANKAENLNKTLTYRPLGLFVI